MLERIGKGAAAFGAVLSIIVFTMWGINMYLSSMQDDITALENAQITLGNEIKELQIQNAKLETNLSNIANGVIKINQNGTLAPAEINNISEAIKNYGIVGVPHSLRQRGGAIIQEGYRVPTSRSTVLEILPQE